MWWAEFERAAPEFAGMLRDHLEAPGLVLVGTVRPDGSARISPVEPLFEAGQLYLDMMWRSLKARDLLRDPRIEVHAAVAGPNAPQYKLHGRANAVLDPAELRRFAEVVVERLGWSPYARHHLFRVGIEAAASVSFGEDAPEGYLRVRTWTRLAGYAERGPFPPEGMEDE